MKKAMVLLTGLLLMSSCQNELTEAERQFMSLSVIRDKTDRHLLKPKANPVLRLFQLHENKNAGVYFRYREITDMTLVPVISYDLLCTSDGKRGDEAFSREKQIVNFYNNIRTVLSDSGTYTDSSILTHSECFTIIAEELMHLSHSNATNRVLLIYSNLFENSDITVYTDGKVNITDPEKIKEKLEQLKLLPQNLAGIKVVFLFTPSSREESRDYMKMYDVYRKMLEAKGAVISVKASNENILE